MKQVWIITTADLTTGMHKNIVKCVDSVEKADEFVNKKKDAMKKLGIHIFHSAWNVE